MDGRLNVGDKVTSTNNIEYTIVKLLGAGGQGEVYEVKAGKDRLALKWYFPSSATPEQLKIINDLVVKGAPNECFLWPKDIITQPETFGYVMDLRPKTYNSIQDLMARRVEPSFEILCKAGINLSKGFQKLHAAGWCYRDISWGNAFIDFSNGKVLICDNDNAVPDRSAVGNISGTLGFMAPEIVMGKERPSTLTDLFSLAVLLFYIFNIHHPLEGELESRIHVLDTLARNRLYGEKPIFIWDPDNRSNRPIPIYQQNAIDFWRLYPRFFKDLFTLAFTQGLHNASRRSTESEWQSACIRLLNSIYYCHQEGCEVENFYDEDSSRLGVRQTCWACHSPLSTPRTINIYNTQQINSDFVVLNRNTKLVEHHAKGNLSMNVIGELSQNPNHPNIWGIRNLSTDVWVLRKPNGETINIGNGMTFRPIKGSKINFGINVGEIS